MATEVKFNPAFFDNILKSAGVENLTNQAALQALRRAQSSAPVKTGDYWRGLVIRKKQARYRTVYQVVGTDWKTMIIESKKGVLARALRAVKI